MVILNGIQGEKLHSILQQVDGDNTEAISIENLGVEHKVEIVMKHAVKRYFINAEGLVTNDSSRL